MRFLSLAAAFLSLPLLSIASLSDQTIMSNAGISNDEPLRHTGKPSLADLLTLQTRVSIFYSYARETEYSSLLSDDSPSGQANGISLFVPTNKAVMALARKPHQGPAESEKSIGDVTISEAEFDRMSRKNVMEWVAAHIVPQVVTFPASAGDSAEYPTLLADKTITIKKAVNRNDKSDPWSGIEIEDGVHIVDMKEASNGVLYIIDGTVAVPK